ncbi:MAG: hypothetical protein V9E92_00815 [Methylotenera sp.]
MKLVKIFAIFLGLNLFITSSIGIAQPIEIKKSEQGIEYVTGGISVDEVDLMNNYIDSFSLRLLFSEGACGRFITDVNVSIYDSQHSLVFKLDNAQPQLFVNLPKGNYSVVGNYNGDEQSHKFMLKENEHKKVVLNWKNCVEEDAIENGEVENNGENKQ